MLLLPLATKPDDKDVIQWNAKANWYLGFSRMTMVKLKKPFLNSRVVVIIGGQ